MIRHLVLFRVRDDVPERDVDRALELLRPLHRLDGVLEWRIELSTDTRKGRVIVEDSLFASAEALERFRTSPEHAGMAAHLAGIADWLVGDYEV